MLLLKFYNLFSPFSQTARFVGYYSKKAMDKSKYFEVQTIAKIVLKELGSYINPFATEESIAIRAKDLLAENGVCDTWYYNMPAFVLLGSRSCLSISGRDYRPSNEPVGEMNLVTVDLSPRVGSVWGDCARSFAVENGRVIDKPKNSLFAEGFNAEASLHTEMVKFVTTETTFSELYQFSNQLITKLGWENLDFLHNLGHSIETSPEGRRFIDIDCHDQLGSASFFTFEPHIRKIGSTWGFKHENIYYFNDNGNAIEL